MRNGAELVTPQAGAMVRTGVDGSTELATQAEVQSVALAAQAEADVKARWAIAQRNPRNMDVVRQRLLSACRRPAFARAARYAKPVGKDKVQGPSIRFVEEALRAMGNVYAPTLVIREDALTRVVQVMVTDLENNISWPRQVTIRKTVERRGDKKGNPPEGRTIVGERTNSYGEKVYEVIATDDELANKEAALISKAIRTAGLRIIPGDLVEEGQEVAMQVAAQEDARDPNATRKQLADAFLTLGVRPDQLAEYLGHQLDVLSPAEVADLRAIYAALRDGETKWAEVMETRAPAAQAPQAGQAASPSPKPAAAPAAASEASAEEPPPPSDADAPPEASAAPSPEEVLLAEVAAVDSERELDALSKRAQALPKGPGRDAVGKALATRRAQLKGAR